MPTFYMETAVLDVAARRREALVSREVLLVHLSTGWVISLVTPLPSRCTSRVKN